MKRKNWKTRAMGILALAMIVLSRNNYGAAHDCLPVPVSAAMYGRPEADSIPPFPWTPNQVPRINMSFPDAGPLQLYGNSQKPENVVLFISGDGGWNHGVEEMALTLARDTRTLVVGIDEDKYYKILRTHSDQCLYPAGDMEALSMFVQRKLHLPDYHKPLLVGYSSGATLVYAILCQAPANTFSGGVALGFCPDFDGNKAFCMGSGNLKMQLRKNGKTFDFTHAAAPSAPMTIIQGAEDQVCDCQKTRLFFENTPRVSVIVLPKVGHGFSIARNWLPEFQKTCLDLMKNQANNAPPQNGRADARDWNIPGALFPPLPSDNGAPLVVFFSGDGGWTSFDHQIMTQLQEMGYAGIGINCQSYFWNKKTPEQTIEDLMPMLQYYMQNWHCNELVLAGYSFGADLVPFIQNRLPAYLRQKVRRLVLLSPDDKGDFEIHVAGMLGVSGGPYDVIQEIKLVQQTPITIIQGDEEEDVLGTSLQQKTTVQFNRIPGGHHYNNNVQKLTEIIAHTP